MINAILIEAWTDDLVPLRRTYETEQAVDAEQERALVEDLVRRLYPGAELASYGDGRATFRSNRRTVKARFVRSPKVTVRETARDQASLFAA
jgi:hypothetical protein